MQIEMLSQICQKGMFLVQWMVMAATSLSLLKCKIKNKAVAFVVYIVAGMGPLALSRILLSITKSVALNMIIGAIIVVTMHICLFKECLKYKAAVGILEVLVTWIGEIGATYMLLTTAQSRGDTLLYTFDSVYSYPEYIVLASIYTTLMSFVLFMILFVCWKGFVEKAWVNVYWLYVIVPLYQLVLLFIFYGTCRKLENVELLTGTFLVSFSLIIDFSLIYLVGGMLRKEQVENELTALYVQRQTEHEYYELAVSHMEEIKEIKKNYREQLQTLYERLDTGEDSVGLIELLDNSSKQTQETSLKRYCENSIVNAILTIKCGDAEEKNIEMDCVCYVPENVGIEAIDLCSLFANLLDNSIEACEKSTNVLKKAISIHAGIRGGYLTVKIVNSYSQPVVKEKGKILTSKADSKNHGYGLKLIDDIVRKYEGNLQIDAEENIFTVVAQLKIVN